MANKEKGYYSYKIGVDVPLQVAQQTFRELVMVAKDSFANTHFVIGGSISHSDLNPIEPFYQTALRVSPYVFNKRTLFHLSLTGRMARVMGEMFNDRGFKLNLDELEAIGYFHDIGRTGSQRRAVNDIWGNLLMKRAGFTGQFLALFPEESKWMLGARHLFDLAELTDFPQKGIVELADAVSKVKDHRIIRWDEFRTESLEGRQLAPDRSSMWRSEYFRQLNAMQRLNDGSAADYYFMLAGWFEAKSKLKVQDAINLAASQLQQQGIELPERS